jgi:acyl-coenzyme A thioesterase PaaI-like protein
MTSPADGVRPGWRRRLLYRFLSLYPPFLGAGIRVRRRPDGFEVRMRLRRWNRNAVGTHFGGSLYAMCDPFFMLLLIDALGPGYRVWDKAAAIRFRRPGAGTVSALFSITPERVAEIRAAADRGEPAEPTFTVKVNDERGILVAQVDKVLHVRRREIDPAGSGG